MYTDITGAFLVQLFKSMQYIFVVYVYDLNAIIVCTMPYHTDASMVTAFTKVITILKAGGYQPALNVMDNECSATVKNISSLRTSTSNSFPHTTIVSMPQNVPSQLSRSTSLQLLPLWTCTLLFSYGMNFARKLNSL
jgi:hypothetical protein